MIKFSYITTNCYGSRSSNGSYATAKAARLAGEANNRRQEWLGADGLSPMFNGEIEKTIVLSDADKALQVQRRIAQHVDEPAHAQGALWTHWDGTREMLSLKEAAEMGLMYDLGSNEAITMVDSQEVYHASNALRQLGASLQEALR